MLLKWCLLFYFPPSSVVGVDLKWREPHKFCTTSGSEWDYQSCSFLRENLEENLNKHYERTLAGSRDKSDHPLFLTMCGPGTGKSRLLDEFVSLAVNCTNGDLKAKLEDAFVFKVSFENSTQMFTKNGPISIGCRMYRQLHPEEIDWEAFCADPKSHVRPWFVIRKLSAILCRDLKDMNVIILVDGMQNLHHIPGEKDTDLHQALQALSQLSNGSGKQGRPFVVCCCAATFSSPIHEVLGPSGQFRVPLLPPRVDGHKILQTEDPVEKMLVGDMGGHGRALEIFCEKLIAIKNIQGDNYSIYDVMNKFDHALSMYYPNFDICNLGEEVLKKLVAAVLTGVAVSPKTRFGEYSVDDIVQLGLFRREKSSTLSCPFIWLKRMVPDLIHEAFCDPEYHRIASDKYYTWQNWEVFIAKFISLKSKVLCGRRSWKEFHKGASFGDEIPDVTIEKLSLVLSTKQYLTKSKEIFEQSKNTKDILLIRMTTMCDTIVVNGSSAPAGDVFGVCEEHLDDNSTRKVVFAYDAKHRKGKRSLKDYIIEKEKACSDRDLFIEFSTSNKKFTEDELPDRCGFVGLENYVDYFGPFAGRVFFSLDKPTPAINTCSQRELEIIPGVSKRMAELIINEREVHKFQSKSDFETRVPALKNRVDLFQF